MLAKLLQALQKRAEISKLRVVQCKSQVGQAVYDSFGIVRRETEGKRGIDGIDRYANRHGLAVP